MAKKLKKETKKQLFKTVKATIRQQLEAALTDVKTELGPKEFKKRVKKATAIFSEGFQLKPKADKSKKVKDKSVKKSSGDKVVEMAAN